MGTSIKTVVYSCTALASLVDNTLTNIVEPVVYLPESGKVFRSCWLVVTCDDIITATGGTVGTRQIDFGLDAIAQTTYSDTTVCAHSGENISHYWQVDVTSYFTTNWSGTSMTPNIEVLVDQTTGTTLGQVNVCVSIHITYEYDDTSATQVKTVWLPLDAPTSFLATSKPGTATATVPALDTHLPEATKTYRQTAVWLMGNTAGSSADRTVSMELDTDGALTTGIYEGSLQTARWTRYIDTNVCAALDTSATASFYIWCSSAVFYHPQIMMQVTYEFDASAANDLFVSLTLPFCATGNAYDSGAPIEDIFDFNIPESGVVGKEIACFPYWTATAAITSLAIRVRHAAGHIGYTDSGIAFAGDNCAMARDDAACVLAQGDNQLKVSLYGSAASRSIALRGFWIVNYTCDKPAGGSGALTRSVSLYGSVTSSSSLRDTNKVIHRIPESLWRATRFAVTAARFTYSTVLYGMTLTVSTGVAKYRPLLVEPASTDIETGIEQFWGCNDSHLLRWTGDRPGRLDPETAWDEVYFASIGGSPNKMYYGSQYTYHSQTFAAAGNVYGSAGGVVRLDLHRAHTRDVTGLTGSASSDIFTTPVAHHLSLGDIVIVRGLTGGAGLTEGAYTVDYISTPTTFAVAGGAWTTDITAGTVTLPVPAGGELLLSTTRVGDGAFSFTWFSPVPDVYVEAYEDDTHIGRSAPGSAGTDTFDVVLGPRAAHAIGSRSIRGIA